MAYGVTSEGFVRKPLSVIREENRARLRAKFGDNFPLDDASVAGQTEGVFSAAVDELWELAQATYSARDPDAAEAAQQDQVGALTGTRRDAAQKSTVTVTMTGTPGSPIALGKVVKTAAGDRFQVNFATEVGVGGTVDVSMESVEYGPVPALAGTLTVIETPIGGVTAVTNALDADPGALEEGDAAYRQRRELELRASGAAAPDPIRGRVLQVEGVTDVMVFSNRTDEEDEDGLPPHSVECLVAGGDDEAVRDAIFETVSAGTETYGSNSGTVTDDAGNSHTINFSRPDAQDAYVRLTVVYDASKYPADGDDQIAEAIVEWADENQVGGKDLVPVSLAAQAFSVSGVLEITAMYIATVPEGDPAPTYPGDFTSSKIVMDLREIALLDTSRIIVTSSPGTP